MDKALLELLATISGDTSTIVITYISLSYIFDFVLLGCIVWGVRGGWAVLKEPTKKEE